MIARYINRPGPALLLVGALALAACGGAADAQTTPEPRNCDLPAGPVALVLGQRANSPAVPETGTELLVAAIDHAIESETWLSLVEVDGDPDQVQSQTVELTAKNGPAREDERRALVSAIGQAVLDIRADDSEADVLAALALAAREVHAHGDQGTIIVRDSGLQTSGVLNHTEEGMLLAAPGEVADYLSQQQALPDLSGITVILSGIGDTTSPQSDLTPAIRSRLIDQWATLAESAGAACTDVDTTPATLDPPPGLPSVTPVALPAPPEPVLDPQQPLRLGEESVGFKPDSDEMIDPDEATANLGALAEELAASGQRVLLTGTTATGGTPEYRKDLSERRAAAVKQALVELGVSQNQVDTEGVGIEHPQHVPDLAPDGTLLPGPATQNRAVFVTVIS